MYGPSLPAKDGKRRKTYLIAILDDATRVIVHAQFYFETAPAQPQGLPQAGHASSAACRDAFTSTMARSSAAACCWRCVLGSASSSSILGRTSRRGAQSWSGGFCPRVAAFCLRVDIDSCGGLEGLNRLLFAWIEGEYHQRRHRGIDGEKPLDRWAAPL